MRKVHLQRVCSSDKGTYGVLSLDGQPLCVTLELPNKGNKKDISCIPCGSYKCKKGKSPSKNKQLDGQVFKVSGVQGRENILIHIGNYLKDTLGCILVGTFFDKNMITGSAEAMRKLLAELPEEFILDIHTTFIQGE